VLTFLSPLFLVGAAAAAVPIVLHLLRREPEDRVKFAVVKLLKQAPVEDTQKHRLRELLLLALRVATLVLLALAFARPFFASGAASSWTGTTLVALDTSYSMDAPGRFERARQLAKDAVAKARSGDRVGVLLFADQAEVVAKPSTDRVLAASAVDQATASFGATRYRSALSVAAQLLSGTPSSSRRGTIVLVTDLQESGWDEGDRVTLPEGVDVQLVDVGPLPANLSVTSVRPVGERVVATLHNAGAQGRDVRARLSVDGRPAGEATTTLGANQGGDVAFALPQGSVEAKVEVDDPRGLAADNVRYAMLSSQSAASVLVIGGSGDASRDAFYLQHALATAARGAHGFSVASVSGSQLSAERSASANAPNVADSLMSRAAAVLVSTRGLERRGRELLSNYVRGGGGLLIAAGSEVDGAVVADVLGKDAALEISPVDAKRQEPRSLAPVDLRHPIFRPFAGAAGTLTLVRFRTAAHIDGAGCQTLARFTNGDNALIECAPGDGRALVFASDFDNRWNDFPLHASFVPFLHEAVGYLASARALASDYLVGNAPTGVPRRPGVYAVPGKRDATGDRRIVVNVDARETDPERLSADEFQSAVLHSKDPETGSVPAEARQQEDDQHLWQYALALMLVTLAVEGIVASRTA
jgi:hypothetical protein